MGYMTPYIEAFLDRQRARGLKENSCRTYRYSLSRTLGYLDSLGRSTAPEDLTLEDVELYVSMAESTRYRSTHLDVTVLDLYVKFHTGRTVTGDNRLLITEYEPRRLFLDKEEFGRIYTHADRAFRMAMVLGAGLGLRISEMVSVKWSDIDGDTILVSGKGHGHGKSVRLMIPEMVQDELASWRQYTARLKDLTGGTILGKAKSRTLEPYSVRELSRRGRALSKQLGIEFTMHSFRRLYATTLYNDVKTDLNSLRILMRHTSLDTTLIYLQDNDARKRRSVDILGDVLRSYL